ncbi:MAG: sulfurtransferase TusA family protein [Flexilinea sp.]
MKNIVDARGLSCPQPVLMTAKAIEKGIFPITVKVDGATARENIRRYAVTKNLKVEITADGDDTTIVINQAK